MAKESEKNYYWKRLINSRVNEMEEIIRAEQRQASRSLTWRLNKHQDILIRLDSRKPVLSLSIGSATRAESFSSFGWL
jgi:hypothetical protein